MSLEQNTTTAVNPPVSFEAGPLSAEQILQACETAAANVAPLWPLENFVATNPFIGVTGASFAEAGVTLGKAGLGDTLMAPSYYLKAIRDGRIQQRDFHAARQQFRDYEELPVSLDELAETLARLDAHQESRWTSVADIVGRQRGVDLERALTDQISEWAGAYFDDGQAIWRSPFSDLSPYRSWLAEIRIDSACAALGLGIDRAQIDALPDDATAVLTRLGAHIGHDELTWSRYLQRLVGSLPGWLGHARYRDWHQTLGGGKAEQTLELLAIRAAWELMLFEQHQCPEFDKHWRLALTEYRHLDITLDSVRACRLLAQEALENASRRNVLGKLKAPGQADQAAVSRPQVQAVFCIDVRSERLRRTLEQLDSEIETLGFAGFFGMPIEVLTIDDTDADAQCPVLLEPTIRVRESGDTPAATQKMAEKIRRERQAGAAWQTFHGAAVSSFAYVEAIGLGYVFKMLRESVFNVFGNGRKKTLPKKVNLAGDNVTDLERYRDGSVDMAESILRGMSLTQRFAPLVALIGHGSSASNNPYASRYHCGACGGHSGDANARMAAALLNDTEVRKQLRLRGIDIPGDTQFIAGLHDTSTDEVTLVDCDDLPNPWAPQLATLRTLFDRAAAPVRRQRAVDHGVRNIHDDDLLYRSRNWAEVRPEWGLVGCRGFIAAPRAVTTDSNLHGRCFLHNYDWKDDRNFEVLELIMTAPLVVASWISLQYFASTVDNQRLGSGDKTLHNVVGGIGVLEGTSGDLRVGLPWQSINDGSDYLHEPVRLNAVLAAPVDAINSILEKHAHVRELFDNQWLHMYALDDDGKISQYLGDLEWSVADKSGVSRSVSPHRKTG